jgi:hypothetical protein
VVHGEGNGSWGLQAGGGWDVPPRFNIHPLPRQWQAADRGGATQLAEPQRGAGTPGTRVTPPISVAQGQGECQACTGAAPRDWQARHRVAMRLVGPPPAQVPGEFDACMGPSPRDWQARHRVAMRLVGPPPAQVPGEFDACTGPAHRGWQARHRVAMRLQKSRRGGLGLHSGWCIGPVSLPGESCPSLELSDYWICVTSLPARVTACR